MRAPVDATMTGSTTRFGRRPAAANSATTRTLLAVANKPVFTAATGRSSSTASIWSRSRPGSVGATRRTSVEFCAVRAAMAVQPCTPKAAKVRRSAWMPAPPPESEPAMVRATGGVMARSCELPAPFVRDRRSLTLAGSTMARPMIATPVAPASRHASASLGDDDAAECIDRHGRVTGDGTELVEPDRRAVARLARGGEDGGERHVVTTFGRGGLDRGPVVARPADDPWAVGGEPIGGGQVHAVGGDGRIGGNDQPAADRLEHRPKGVGGSTRRVRGRSFARSITARAPRSTHARTASARGWGAHWVRSVSTSSDGNPGGKGWLTGRGARRRWPR